MKIRSLHSTAFVLGGLTFAALGGAQNTGDTSCVGVDWSEGDAVQLDSMGLRDGCAQDYDPNFHIEVMRAPTQHTARDDHDQPYTFTTAFLYESDWNDGWGWTNAPTNADTDTPYCILAEAVSVMERAGARADTIGPNRFVLKEALAYVKKHTPRWEPRCKKPNDEDFEKAANSGSPDWLLGIGGSYVRLFQNFFKKTAGERAAVLLHEAWHRGTNRGHTGGKVNGKGTDQRYNSIYAESDSLSDGGVSTYSVDVAWLEDYIKLSNDAQTNPTARASINEKSRNGAFERGNRILQTRFKTPTSKRLSMFTIDSVLNALGSTSLADPGIQAGVIDDRDAPESENTAVLGALPGEPCGLMGIHGAFREKGDYVKVVEEQATSGSTTGAIKKLVSHSDHRRESRATGGLAACFPAVDVSFDPAWFMIMDNDKSFTARLLSNAGDSMHKDDHTCFITGIEGRLEGEYDAMGVRLDNEDLWEVFLKSNSTDNNNYQKVEVSCVAAKFTYQIDQGADRSQSVLFDKSDYSASGFSHQCALSQVTGRMFNINDLIWIREQDYSEVNERNLACEGPYSSHSNTCTTWNVFIDGNGHIYDRNQTAAASCFEYPKH